MYGGLLCYFPQSCGGYWGGVSECGFGRAKLLRNVSFRCAPWPRIDTSVGSKPVDAVVDSRAVETISNGRHTASGYPSAATGFLGAPPADHGGDGGSNATAGKDGAPGAEGSAGNLGADGEPPATSPRRTGVTETLSPGVVLPQEVFARAAYPPAAPHGAASWQAPAPATWDADEIVTEIYTSHYNQLVRLALLLVRDVQTAEEVVQDAFEQMHKAWRRLHDPDKALSYLRQTVVNRSRSVLRHRKVVDLHPPKPAPDEPSAEHGALTLIERSAVVSALRLLPVRQREAIVLRYYADLSEADIAKTMGISKGAVKSHTARAMAALKSTLTQEAP